MSHSYSVCCISCGGSKGTAFIDYDIVDGEQVEYGFEENRGVCYYCKKEREKKRLDEALDARQAERNRKRGYNSSSDDEQFTRNKYIKLIKTALRSTVFEKCDRVAAMKAFMTSYDEDEFEDVSSGSDF